MLAVEQTAVIQKRLKAAEPTMVLGPSGPAIIFCGGRVIGAW